MTVQRTLTIAAIAILALAGCGAADSEDDAAGRAAPGVTAPADSSADSLLAAYGLAGLDGREIVDRLDRLPVAERPTDLMASVRSGELHLSGEPDEQPAVVALPTDEFYLSVAPYVDHTHDCYFHSLTTCLGELAGEQLAVTITDLDTGEVLVNEVTEVYDNGFVGFWLPSGIDATIEIEHDGRAGTEQIATGPEDPTCLTTLQLA
ncbi:CueP family metal-binding protein [Natronosporangium hydrolyticum]|uniref:CueP family metal-binding protein n=1 Tax=Natronosporangium hydrolyticum TaxID=2811111 RepID=A0A895YE96_9ACTN|nr:CueP family metal-binding protein [Natronosporangium hydrolyticum]QSB16164.1 CueP family metal-binding protein [Natronosporangium hydrolyticum]